MSDLSNTSAIVTGGASGLGAAVAAHLAGRGAKVCLFDMNADAATATAAQLGATWQQVDVSDPDSVKDAFEKARAKQGQERVLVNCAGIGPASKTVSRGEPHDSALFAKVIGANLLGSFYCASNAAAGMAMLGLCDHLILTIGTYGWLGAWLGPQALGRPGDRASRDRREILYFDDEFTSRYRASMQFVHEDYYPASWTAMRPAAVKRRPTNASMAVQQPIEERWVPVAYAGNCSTLRAHSRRHGGYRLQTSCHADVTQSAAAYVDDRDGKRRG